MAAPANDPGARGASRAARWLLAPPSCGDQHPARVPRAAPRRSSLRLPLSLPGSFASLTMIYPDGLLAVASQHGDHHAADLDVGGARDDRSELLVGGHEADAPALAIELLHGRLAAHERDHGGAVLGVGTRLDHDQVAVEDALADHRVAAHAQREGLAAAEQLLGEGHGLRHLD